MKSIFPAIIIGLVGGILDELTQLHKVWCFLIGVVVFLFFVFIKSIFITVRIRRQAKGKTNVWIDQYNRIVEPNYGETTEKPLSYDKD